MTTTDSQSLTVREALIALGDAFVNTACRLPGIHRIALLGSCATAKRDPKDIDFLVTVADDADLAPLARAARHLQGRAQGLNRGADIFLANDAGRYLGRTCHWKQCMRGIRLSCDARHCGRRPHLHDDLDVVNLASELVATPPIELWPSIVTRIHVVPADVDRVLLRPRLRS